ncbi:hypothetical protein [Candidatus Pantoea multigeneris]|uniref:hypothetical protein n=1 Tax=Candidatus Pantoea multigeneris TaxID=2608357 RepID=UPI0014221E34|nr:hypothetical protein [Pantoea multigeneris]
MIIVYEREFDAITARALQQRVSSATLMRFDEARAHPWEVTQPSFVVMILSGRHPASLPALTQQLHLAAIPHSAVILSDDALTCGPLVIPGKSVCFGCASKRSASMVEKPRTAKQDRDFHAYLEATPRAELRGYMPALIEMAVIKMLQHLRCQLKDAGVMSVFSLADGHAIESRILALHGCDCRQLQFSSTEQRWTQALRRGLEGILHE